VHNTDTDCPANSNSVHRRTFLSNTVSERGVCSICNNNFTRRDLSARVSAVLQPDFSRYYTAELDVGRVVVIGQVNCVTNFIHIFNKRCATHFDELVQFCLYTFQRYRYPSFAFIFIFRPPSSTFSTTIQNNCQGYPQNGSQMCLASTKCLLRWSNFLNKMPFMIRTIFLSKVVNWYSKYISQSTNE